MGSKVEIDEVDEKIIGALIKDARISLKNIAKECGMSSVAVLHRIKRLKKLGVITGATLFVDFSKLGVFTVATLGIDLDAGHEEEIFELIKKQVKLIEPSLGVGKYDLCALVYAENLASLERTTQAVRKHAGIKKVTANIWISAPLMTYENLDLRAKK